MQKISSTRFRMLRAGISFFIILSLSLAGVAIAAGLQAAPAGVNEGETVSQRFGVVASHVKLHNPDLMREEFSALRRSGATWVRLDLAWPDLEPARGNWDFSGADLAIELAAENGLQVLAILGAAPLWANGQLPWNWPPVDVAAWSTYVSTVTARYADRVAAWEIWNEENITAFWQPYPNAAQYLALLEPASRAIRESDPDGLIVMGGMAGLDYDYLENCLALGAAKLVDVLAYHPYPETLTFANYTPQEAGCRDIVKRVRNLISEYTTKPLQIWLTEIGWTTTSPGIDRRTQAAYMLRSLINYASTELTRVFVHNLRDEYDRAFDPEQNYGLLASDGSAKISYDYYRFFEDELGDSVSTAAAGIDVTCSDNSRLEVHAFARGSDDLVVALWRSDDVADVATLVAEGVSDTVVVMVDPATRVERAVADTGRDDAGNLVLRDLPVGKEPVLLKLHTKTSVFTEEGTQPPVSPPVAPTPKLEDQLRTGIRGSLPWFQILWGLRRLILAVIGLL